MSSRAVVILGVIGLIVALGVLFAVFFGVQTFAVIFVKRTVSKRPETSMVPQKLVMASPAGVPGTRFSYSGYEFELPWTDVTEDVKESSVRVNSGSGKIVLFLDFTQRPGIFDSGEVGDDLKAEFGNDSYAFYKTMLNTTPDQLSVFMPREESIRVRLLLSLKAVLVPVAGPPSGIFAFAHGDFRGFQFGDPAVADKVFVKVFHQDERAFEIVFLAGQGPRAQLSQDDINRLITTLKPAEESEAQ